MPVSSNLGLELFVPGDNIAEWSNIISDNFNSLDLSFFEIIEARGTHLSIKERIDYLEAGITSSTFTPLVLSFNGRTGAIIADKSDVGLSNVDNTSDLLKPVSTATQVLLDQKAGISHTHAVANIVGLKAALDQKSPVIHTHTPSQVGLGLVKNISPEDMPISRATANALDQKADNDQHWPIDNITGLRTILDNLGSPHRFEAIMNGLTYSIPQSVHNITKISSVMFLDPFGRDVSIVFTIDSSENVVVESGILLDNHKIVLTGI